MILHIIDRQPECNFELLKMVERFTNPEVQHIKSETGILSLSRIKIISDREKDLLVSFIKQVAPYLGINTSEERKLDIP